MTPPKHSFTAALATFFSSRKFVRRSQTARRRLAALRSVTARQRFGLASRAATLVAAGVLAFGANDARAASATFTAAPVDANWATGGNWSTGVAPGNTAGTATNADTATFNNAPSVGTSANPIIIDAGRTITGITFDTANAQSFQIGTTTGNALRLSNTATGTNSTQLTATVVNPQVIAAPIVFAAPSSTNGAYTFQNNSTTTAATLTLSGAITGATSASRPGIIYLNGTNTGNNTISGVITSAGQGQSTPLLLKRGTGTWVLSSANAFTGTAMTTINANNGIQVLDGVLSLQNNAALGTSAAANSLQVYVGNKSTTYGYNSAGTTTTVSSASGGGTLELANNITLDNGLILFLYNGGTIRSSGSTTSNAGISLSTVAATSATLATVNAADVFTVGNATNDVTGGASDTLVNVGGPGTVFLSQASNYLGSYSINSGTLRVGNATALGAATTANVVFGAGSTGRLQLFGNSPTIAGLSTNATTVGTPVVENGAAGTATLTVSNTTARTYAGVLQNGTVGVLALTKSGTGALTLSGANTYSGATTINGGTLFANNTTGSATGSSTVGVVSGGTLGGSGTITGAVTVAGRVSPGATGTSSVGNLTVGSLTLNSGANLDYDITSTAVLDQITVTGANGLTINGGTFNLNGGTSAFTTNGVYNLIGYNGTVGGTGVSALALNTSNQNLTTNTYTFGLSGSYVTLTIAPNSTVVDYYVPDADGAFSVGTNWSTGSAPNATGAFAAFGGSGSTALTANRTVTVDGAYTVGTLSFNSTTGFGYTLANGGAGTGIILNNGATNAFLTDSAGNHTVDAPLTLTANGLTTTVTAAADTLTVSGVVSSDATTDIGLTKAGNGTLALLGANTYFGGTGLNGGMIQINSAASLGDVSGNLVFNGGNLQLLADVTTTRNYQLNGSNNAIIDTNGHALTLNGTLTPISTATGGLVKNGLGTLTLGGINTYTGTTAINAGIVSVGADTALGATPASATTNVIIGAGALQANASFTLNANRNISLTNAASDIDTTSGSILSVSSAITGSGGLTKTGAGQLTITTPTAGQNTYSGGTTANGGTILLGDTSAVGNGLGTGAITFTGGTVSTRFQGNTVPASATADLSENLVVNTGQTGTLVLNGRQALDGTLTGAGTLNLQVDYVRDSLNGNWSAFTGQLNLLSNTNGGDFRLNTTTGFGTSKVNLGAGTNLYVILNFNPSATINIGELSGDATSSAAGGTVSGRYLTYSVGGANTDATYAGVIKDSTGQTAVIKVGTGSWTLSGTNTYTQPTTVNGGALNITGSLAAASAVTVNNTGTLSGVGGTVNGTVTVNNGGTLLAGTGGANPTVGNLTVGNTAANGSVTLNAGSTFSAVLGSDTSVSQLLAVSSATTATTVSAAGAFGIVLTNGASFAAANAGMPDVLTLIPAGFTGTFTNPDFTIGGYLFTADYTTTPGGFDVDVTAVPEPATWLAGFLMVGALGYKGRKQIGSLLKA